MQTQNGNSIYIELSPPGPRKPGAWYVSIETCWEGKRIDVFKSKKDALEYVRTLPPGAGETIHLGWTWTTWNAEDFCFQQEIGFKAVDKFIRHNE